MRKIFSLLKCKVEDIDFPEELVPFQNRTVLRTTLGAMRKRDPSGIWIKPVTTKLFDAFPYTTKNDLAIAEEFSDDTEVWISEQEEFVSEWRVYILKKDMTTMREVKHRIQETRRKPLLTKSHAVSMMLEEDAH